MEKRTFKLCESGLPHYYVFGKLFILFDEAMAYCDVNGIPYDFIIKTKYIIDYANWRQEKKP